MATATYEAIASYTTSGSSTTSYTFTSIPSTFTDIVLIGSTKLTSGGAGNDSIQLNGETSSSYYSFTIMYGTGSTAGSYRRSSSGTPYSGIVIDDTTSSEYNTINFNLMNYSNTSVYKTIVGRYGVVGSTVGATVGLWQKTEAINSIKINAGGVGTWAADTTFTLYGIKAA